MFKKGGRSLGGYWNVTSKTFLRSGCSPENIISSFSAIDKIAATSEGIKQLNSIFQVNSTMLLNSTKDVENYLKPYIRDAFDSLVELDYPYPANFLAPLPAWPVKVVKRRGALK